MPPVDNRVLVVGALFALGALGACTEDTSIFDPFPIPVDVDGGVIILGARSTDLDSTGAVHRAVLDTGSAFTIFDDGASSTTRGHATVQVLAAQTNVPRAQFDAVNALLSPTGQVGDGTEERVHLGGGDGLPQLLWCRSLWFQRQTPPPLRASPGLSLQRGGGRAPP